MSSSTPSRKPASHRTSPRRPLTSPGIEALPSVIPEIVVGFDEEAVANAGIAALAACPELFTHGGQLVTLVPVPNLGAALPGASPALQIERLPTPRLRELLSRSARWLVPRSDDPAESVLSHVPAWAVSGIAARREWPGLRPLTALVTAPVLRPDGTVLESPGYDPVTGLYLAPHAPHPRVPEHPTQADARSAAEVLLASVRHIPFATPVDRAAWLAMALTTPARFAVGAASPLCIVEDGARSRWAEEVIADLAAVVGAAPLAVVDVDELLPSPRRPFDALRVTGEPAARISNGAAMGWRRIHEALLRGRATVGVVWFAATSRLMRDVELTRQALTVRCEGGEGDGHGDDAAQDEATPATLLVAALTILRAYQVAGCPDLKLPRWPGFERWSQVVRAAVVWSGLPDPIASFTAAPEPTSATDATIADLVVGWSELRAEFLGGCSTRQALDALNRATPEAYPRLRRAVAVLAPGPLNERSTADRIGRCLRRYRDEQHEGWALVLAGSGNQGNRWAVRSVP
jgi:putative DNA primase/helicase